MKAAVMVSMGNPLVVADVADPTPGHGEAVVAVDACGICGSDLHASDNLPFSDLVMGHEFCGTVVATGAGDHHVSVGDRVVGLSLATCGRCEACVSGRIRKCLAAQMVGIERPGAYAEYVALPSQALLHLPDSLDHRHGALVEPLAVARHAVERAGVKRGDRVAVVGAGPVGLAVTAWLNHMGASQIVAIDPAAARRSAAESLGASHSVDPQLSGTGIDVPQTVADLCGGAPTRVIECVGIPGILQQSIDIAGVDGTVAVTGVCMEPETVVPLVAMVKELDVRFAFFYRRQDMVETIAAMASGQLDAVSMVTDEISLTDVPKRFETLKGTGLASTPDAEGTADTKAASTDVKVLVRPNR